MDFFVVPTVLFKVLFVFVVLAHERRRVVHTQPIGIPASRSRRPNAFTCRSDPPVLSRTSTPTSIASNPMSFAVRKNAAV